MADISSTAQLQKKITAMSRLHREQMDKLQARVRDLEQRLVAADHQRDLAEKRERAAILENLQLTRRMADLSRLLKAHGVADADDG